MQQTDAEVAAEYRPEMDGKAHEKTYSAFGHFTAVGAVGVACVVAGLALGAGKHAWLSALFMIVCTLVATTIGLFSASISWRAPGAILALLLLMLALY